MLKRKRLRPSLSCLDRIFVITLRSPWQRWTDVLVLVKPQIVVAWHRVGFRFNWRGRFRPRGGRPRVGEVLRILIRLTASENSKWGATKIHGELLKLRSEGSESTVARYLRMIRPRCGDPAKRWLSFLANHREAIAAIDYFAAPTSTASMSMASLTGRERA